jgi:hypothetical protein
MKSALTSNSTMSPGEIPVDLASPVAASESGLLILVFSECRRTVPAGLNVLFAEGNALSFGELLCFRAFWLLSLIAHFAAIGFKAEPQQLV